MEKKRSEKIEKIDVFGGQKGALDMFRDLGNGNEPTLLPFRTEEEHQLLGRQQKRSGPFGSRNQEGSFPALRLWVCFSHCFPSRP